ncbi:MAG: hypothetical protein Q8O63_13490, partial [Hoeflea sp.]|nr:hypothetical protein [Hoeflea sp.]
RCAGAAMLGRTIWVLAGGLLLAGLMPGTAQAQTVQREPTVCPNEIAGGSPTPPGTRCFIEYTEATALEWRGRIAEAMLCESGETDCGPTAQAVFDAARADNEIVFLDPGAMRSAPGAIARSVDTTEPPATSSGPARRPRAPRR